MKGREAGRGKHRRADEVSAWACDERIGAPQPGLMIEISQTNCIFCESHSFNVCLINSWRNNYFTGALYVLLPCGLTALLSCAAGGHHGGRGRGSMIGSLPWP